MNGNRVLRFSGQESSVTSGVLTNFLQLFGRKPDRDYEHAFVEEVHVEEDRRLNPRMNRMLLIGWALILGKCILVWWACVRYAVPIHPLWVIVPTIVFAALCTGLYLGGRRR